MYSSRKVMCKICKSTGAFQWAFPCKKGVDTAENGPSEFGDLLQASLTNALEWYRSHFPLQMCFFRWNVRLSLVTKTYERDYWKNIFSTSWILARWRQSRRACHSAFSMAAAMCVEITHILCENPAKKLQNFRNCRVTSYRGENLSLLLHTSETRSLRGIA